MYHNAVIFSVDSDRRGGDYEAASSTSGDGQVVHIVPITRQYRFSSTSI